jgi:hypothetical protein
LKYRFRYVDGLEEDRVSASLVFGSAIHAAVEFFFTEQLSGATQPELDTLLEVYQASWNERSHDTILEYGASETRDSLHELADRMLRTFLTSELAQPEGTYHRHRRRIPGRADPGTSQSAGLYRPAAGNRRRDCHRDFKTSRSLWNPAQANEQADQLLLYADLVRQVIPDKPVRLQFAVITKARDPKVQLLEASFQQSKLDRTKRVFHTVWSAIQAGHFYPSPSPLQCPSCGYRTQCQAWRGNSKTA